MSDMYSVNMLNKKQYRQNCYCQPYYCCYQISNSSKVLNSVLIHYQKIKVMNTVLLELTRNFSQHRKYQRTILN